MGVAWEVEEVEEVVLCLWGFEEEAGEHQEVEVVLHMGKQTSAPSIQTCQCANGKQEEMDLTTQSYHAYVLAQEKLTEKKS